MSDLGPVFEELRKIMAPYAAKLTGTRDDDTELYVDTLHMKKNRKPMFFGAVQVKKSCVRFRLMPIYAKPDLLVSASAELKARTCGLPFRTCFR